MNNSLQFMSPEKRKSWQNYRLFAVLFFVLLSFPRAGFAAISDDVYIIDQYNERWQPGEITSANIFATIDDSNVVNKNDDEKVIAPGTRGEYEFTVHNDHSKTIVYYLVGNDENPQELPLDFRLQTDNGTWLKGGESTWSLWRDTFPLRVKRVLSAGDSERIKLYWQWPFERDRDAEDTSYGDLAKHEDIFYSLNLKIIVEEADEGSGSSTDDSSSSATSSEAPTSSSTNSSDHISSDIKDISSSDAYGQGDGNDSSGSNGLLPDTGNKKNLSFSVIGGCFLIIGALLLKKQWEQS